MLPDSPGHVVWLHAPLGYGKSILAAQWAEALEIDGWRILWTAMVGGTVQETVAAVLRLPAAAPWAVIHEELALEPTLLVIEDLQGDEELEALLRGNSHGLVLLASRTRLQEPELLRLRTEGRLRELGAEQLAFTEDEARQLAVVLNTGPGVTGLRETDGWPLLLHFALLTGEAGSGPLHVALKRSVSADAWQEALFLAAAGTIEHSAANHATTELVAAGFLQELQRHYRLHPLLADHLLRSNRAEVWRALETNLDRLRRMDPARACQRAGHDALMAAELDRLHLQVVGENCAEYLQLSRLVPTTASPARRNLRESYARMIVDAEPANARALESAVASEDLPGPELFEARLHAAVMFSRVGFHEEAARQISAAMTGQSSDLPFELLRLHVARVLVQGYAGDYHGSLAAASAARELALALGTPEARALAVVAVQNATPFRFELTGDAGAEVEALAELAADPLLDPERHSQILFNLAVNLTFDLQDDRALAVARQCSEHAEPFWRLWADVIIAYQTGDVGAFPALYQRAGNWEMNTTLARVGALWLRTCRKVGDLVTPGRIAHTLPADPYVQLELALHQLALGNRESAGELLALTAGGYPNREFRQHRYAASFLITGDEADLDELLRLSVNPAKLVRYVLLPLSVLPRDRPELASEFPLEQVLASGWKEAITYRRAEIPRLEVRLLGTFRVLHLGKEVQLSSRQQQIITLLALGFSKERVATEMWPESPAGNSSNNLNVQLHLLRRILEPWGLPTYLADGSLTHADVDVHRLRTALAAGDTVSVLNLYLNDLVPELDSPALEEERDSLKREVLNHLTAAAGATKPADSLHLLERVLELEPLHEQAIALLASQLIRLGRRNAARKRVAEFSARLQQETGLKPTSELMALLAD